MPDDATRDFGAYLRDARVRADISLRTIAESTKISIHSLEALERNDVSRLPGGIFLRAFVREYAKEVGLDPEETLQRFVSRFPDAAAVEELTVREPVQESERRVLGDDATGGRVWRVVGWSLPLVLVIVYFGFGGRLSWLRDQLKPATKVERQAEQQPPAPDAPVLSTPAAGTLPDPNAAPTMPATVPPAAADAGAAVATNAVPPSTAPGTPSDAVRALTPSTPANPGTSPGAAGAAAATPAATVGAAAGEGRFSVTLAARARCWVNVRSNGKIVFAGTMSPGDRQDLVLGGNVSLTVGDAAAMSMEIDGKPTRPLGTPGQVRTLLLNAQNLKDYVESR